MAVNLVGMVIQYLTPGTIGRIAAAFNLDSKSAQSAAEVSVPSLLAGGLIGQLSPKQRKILTGLVNQFMPTLNSLFDKVLTIPGVAELIQPTIDELRTTLAGMLLP